MKRVDVILPLVSIDAATARAGVTRVEGGAATDASDRVAVERGLEVRIDGESFAVVMRTPGADRDLAAGFLLSEGVIRSSTDIAGIDASPEDVVDVELTAGARERAGSRLGERRRVTANAACGACGRASLSALAVEAPTVEAAWVLDAAVLVSLPSSLADRQEAFAETGGLHAAAIVTADGSIVDSAEDVGRHNAVDKIVGRSLLNDRLPLSASLLFVSGRTSFEIVQKAWLAGIPVVAAVSAPSSLAIELAERAGITLIGFVRERRFNIYTHRQRCFL